METDFNLDLDAHRNSSTEDPVSGYHLPLPRLLSEQLKHLELLAHLASYSELLVAVTGPEGSGKTVLAQALAAQREEPEESLFITADLMLGMPAILNQIARYWDMPQLADDIIHAREAIKDVALLRYKDGISLLVIIDQADQLDADTLNEIAHFALLAPQAISFALFGQPGFELAFRESPAQAPVHVLHLEPLSLDDSAALIQQVFSPGQPLALSQDELLFIWQQSGGWPQALLHQAEDYLLSPGMAETVPAAKAAAQANRFPLLHMLAIAGVAAALIVSFLYRDADKPATLAPDNSLAVTDTLPDSEPSPFISTPDNGNEPVAAEGIETTEITPPVVKTDSPATEPDYNYAAAESSGGSSETPSETVAPAPVQAPAAEADAITTPLASQPASTPAAEVAAPAVAKPQRSADERALLAANGGFVVQLFGSYQADNAKGFRQQWQAQIAGSLYQYRTEHNDRPWFVVVAGVYGSRAEAKAAVNALPRELRTQSPWIREVSAVQNVLR